MYVADILLQCAGLAARTSRVYRELAVRFESDPERARLWRELALEEEVHADVLQRELEAFRERDDAGSFLPEYESRLQQIERDLSELERRARTAATLDDALAVAVALEQGDLEEVYDDLFLQGEPAFKIFCERIEAALNRRPNLPGAAGLARRFRRSPSA